MAQEAERIHLRAMVNHIPVPLIAVKEDGRLSLLNNASRRFFGTFQPAKVDDLKQYGEDFFEQLTECRAGEKRIAKISIDGFETKLSLSLMEVTSGTGTERPFHYSGYRRRIGIHSTECMAGPSEGVDP